MAQDLISLATGALSGDFAARAAGVLGENEAATRSGIQRSLGAILGGTARMAAAPGGARSLFDMVNAQIGKLGSIDQLGGAVLADTARRDELLSSGGGIVEHLFGGNLGSITSALAGGTGLRIGSASVLLRLAAPFVLGLLHRKISTDRLDANGLAALLAANKPFIAKANTWMQPLPEQVAVYEERVGVYDVADPPLAAEPPPRVRPPEPARQAAAIPLPTQRVAVNHNHKARSNWTIPVVLLGLLAFGGYALSRMRRHPATEVSVSPNVTQPVIAPTATAPIARGGGPLELAHEPAAVPTAAEPAPVAPPALVDLGTNHAKVLFATGSSHIGAEGHAVIERFAAAMRAQPGARIRLDGFTDSAGHNGINDPLSQARADAVRSSLIEAGIAPDRIAADAHASLQPEASNDTLEGRAENRRTELTLLP